MARGVFCRIPDIPSPSAPWHHLCLHPWKQNLGYHFESNPYYPNRWHLKASEIYWAVKNPYPYFYFANKFSWLFGTISENAFTVTKTLICHHNSRGCGAQLVGQKMLVPRASMHLFKSAYKRDLKIVTSAWYVFSTLSTLLEGSLNGMLNGVGMASQ